MKNTLCFIAFIMLTTYCRAQLYIEPLAGFGFDIKNASYNFKQVNTGIQLSLPTKNNSGLLLKIEKGWGLKTWSNISAFSYDPLLPIYSNAEKIIGYGALSFSAGLRYNLSKAKSLNMLSLLVMQAFVTSIIK